MGKLTTYLLVMSGLMLIFHFSGLIDTGTTPNSQLLDFLLNPQDYQTSTIWLKITGVLAVITAGAVLLSLFTSRPELAAISPLAAFLIFFFMDVMAIFAKLRETNQIMAIILFAPMMFLMLFTIVDWWRGKD